MHGIWQALQQKVHRNPANDVISLDDLKDKIQLSNMEYGKHYITLMVRLQGSYF